MKASDLVMVLHLTLESLILLELFGLWIASGFGLFLRRPFFERIHYDIVQAYLTVFFREARRVLRPGRSRARWRTQARTQHR